MSPESAGRILLVDDEQAIRAICGRVLSRKGYQVETAGNGSDAIAMLRQHDYDLVITDISMPGDVDGTKVVEEMKRLRSLANVIVMTAFPALETAVPTLKNGAIDYLIKPFDQNTLERVVEGCLDRRRLNDELSLEKQMHQELKAAYAQLQELSQMKEAFMARMNHELRIPLTPALLAVDLLDKSTTDPQAKSLCELAKKRLHQMQSLIEDLLLFSEIRKRKDVTNTATIPLKKMLTTLVEQFCCEWHDQSIKVMVSVAPDCGEVQGVPSLMEAAMRHLFLNAVRFNRKSGTIQIEARRQDHQVEISFSDSGVGIPEDKWNAIFDSFYQVADYLTREVGGVGLGLAIVKQIAQMHGGNVAVTSRPGEGSTFTLVLPDAA